jgi:NitT/TauT family transport system substrate-binding protein
MRLASLLMVCWLFLPNGCDKSKSTPASTAQQAQTIRLMLDWKPEPEFGGFYQAQLSGNFQKHGLKVELKSAGEGAPTWQLVANGQTEFATTAADQVIIARQSGADVVALFAVYQTSPQGILVHRSRGFTSLKDVFTHPGTLAAENNAWLRFCLKEFGTPVVKITGYNGGIATFLAKDDFSQQCFVTSEPIEAARKGSDPQTFLIAEAGFNPYTTVVIAQRKLLAAKPELARAMAAAFREGWLAYLNDPAAANQRMNQLNPEMDMDTFTFSIRSTAPYPIVRLAQHRASL